ncbi:hypothetical protein LINGRAHAP2_LOCUS30064 [Linum grandiflorum]
MGRFRMVDLESKVFLATFDDSSDYFQALSGGPWMILGHYLTVFAWDAQFRISDALPQKMVVWIRFPRLPYQYYNQDVLEGLGNLVGKYVRVDNRTHSSARGKFARIAVEIDLLASVPKGVYVDGVWQVLEYENLPIFCRKCGRFGHENGECEQPHASSLALISEDSSPQLDHFDGVIPTSEPDGPWQTVTRRRRPKKASASRPIVPPSFEGAGRGKDNIPKSKAIQRQEYQRKSGKVIVGKELGKSSNGRADVRVKPKIPTSSSSGLSVHQKSDGVSAGSIKITGPSSFSSRPASVPKAQRMRVSDISSDPQFEATPFILEAGISTVSLLIVPLLNSTAPQKTSHMIMAPIVNPSTTKQASSSADLIFPLPSAHDLVSIPADSQPHSLALPSSQLPSKSSLPVVAKCKSMLSKTLHGVSVRRKSAVSTSRSKKKQNLITPIAPICFNTFSDVTQDDVLMETFSSAHPILDFANGSAAGRGASEEEFDASSDDEVDGLNVGLRDSSLQRDKAQDPSFNNS